MSAGGGTEMASGDMLVCLWYSTGARFQMTRRICGVKHDNGGKGIFATEGVAGRTIDWIRRRMVKLYSID